MNNFKRTNGALLLLLVLTLVLAVAGCTKSSDDDDDNNGFSASTITFTPDQAGGAGEIRLILGQASPETNTLVLQVVGDEITGAYGVSGRLLFDTQIAALTGIEAKDALEGNLAEIVAMSAGNDKGGVFGVSRSIDFEHSADLTTDKVVAELTFTVEKAGETKIEFNEDRSIALDHDLDQVEITAWLGGTLTVE